MPGTASARGLRRWLDRPTQIIADRILDFTACDAVVMMGKDADFAPTGARVGDPFA